MYPSLSTCTCADSTERSASAGFGTITSAFRVVLSFRFRRPLLAAAAAADGFVGSAVFFIVFGFTFALFIADSDDAFCELSCFNDGVGFAWSPAAGMVLFDSVLARDVTRCSAASDVSSDCLQHSFSTDVSSSVCFKLSDDDDVMLVLLVDTAVLGFELSVDDVGNLADSSIGDVTCHY